MSFIFKGTNLQNYLFRNSNFLNFQIAIKTTTRISILISIEVP